LTKQFKIIVMKKVIVDILVLFGIGLILFLTINTASAQMTFVHPGSFSSKAELDFVKGKIAIKAEPWNSAFNQLLATGYTGAYTLTTSPQDGAENAQRDDARKAYACALAWYYTGTESYAQTAIAVLNTWGKTFNGYATPPVGQGNQSQLNCGWIGSMMGPAADIMLGYSVANGGKWALADIATVKDMFKTKFYPALKQMSTWNANNDLVQIEALIALAVFCEDETSFNLAITRLNLRNPAYFYLSTDAPATRNYGGNAYPGSWFAPILVTDGLTQETCRDNDHHAQFALTSAIHIAEVAWHQGIDLYEQNRVRYIAAVELMAHQLVTNNMQGTCLNNIPLSSTGGNPTDLYDVFEFAYNHYHNRMGFDLPYTAQELAVVRKNPAQGNAISKCDWNIFYETLTHADIVDVPISKCTKPNLGVDQSICGQNAIILNSALQSTTNKTFIWYKDNVVIPNQTTSLLTITQAGTYKLDVDSVGCKTTDNVIISGTLTVNLGTAKELCSPAVQILDAGIGNGSAAAFKWNTGASTQSISVSNAGTYSVTVSAANCTSVSSSVAITSKLLSITSDTTCTAGSVTLNAGGAYNWFDVATGGTALVAASPSYSPTISTTKMYYVEDPGGMAGSVGKTVVGAGTIWGGAAAADFSDAGKINQIVVAKALTINSLAMYVSALGNVTINLKQGATTAYTKTVTVTGTGKQVINLGFTVVPGTYILDAMGTTATIGFEATGAAPAFPYIFTDYLTYTYNVAWSQTNGWYGYFYDLKFTAGNTCARTPVMAVIDPNNAKCSGGPKTVTQTINLIAGWNLISTNVVSTDSSIATLFSTLDVQEIKTANAYWLKGQNIAFNSLNFIVAGQGYLVKMNVAGTLSITGMPIVIGSIQTNISLGWHLIGCSYQVATPLSSVFSSANITAVKNFDGFWFPNGTMNSISTLVPGKGYFMK
jgi:hypothetical protein